MSWPVISATIFLSTAVFFTSYVVGSHLMASLPDQISERVSGISTYPALSPRQSDPMSDFIRRPLFAPTRRLFEPPSAELSLPKPELSPSVMETPLFAATLVGVVISPERRAAIVRVGESSNIIVNEGDVIRTWTLVNVSPDSALFLSGTMKSEIWFTKHTTTPNNSFSSDLVVPTNRRTK